MKINKYIYAGLVASALCMTTGCSDTELAKINTDPSVVTTPDIRYLFTTGLQEFKPSEYWAWFYDYSAMCKYGQVTGGSNTNRLNMPDLSSGGGMVKKPLLQLLEIENQMSLKDEETAATYTRIHAMMQALVVYMGITDTDFYGSMCYSEAYRARYGGTLKPKYDTQEELFKQFYDELKKATDDLTNDVVVNGKTISQVSLGNQDFVYKGDVAKWAKFANSLKLKLAVRLLNADPAKAKTIAQEAVANKAGLMTSVDDDFIYNQGSEWYHSQENITPGTANYNLINFLVDNRDPRVRFFFEKNDFNSEVVQAYFDAGQELPDYIAKNVEYTTDASGKKTFKAWKGAGEPWIRYIGLPVQINASENKKWEQYYDKQSKWLKLKLNGKEKYYSATCGMQLELFNGTLDYTYPTKPDGAVVQDKEDRPFYALYMSSGEVNLYLAELSQLGVISGNAKQYYEAGVRNSVTEWDKIAGLNVIPYYAEKYDPNEALIALKDGEIDNMMRHDAYKWDDAHALEKIYLQMHIAFIFQPQEMYVTMRRSGVPMKNSTILPYENWKEDGSDYPIPRRATFTEPGKDDQMCDLTLEAYKAQGFTIGNEAQKLQDERVWYDKNAPAWGAGPKK